MSKKCSRKCKTASSMTHKKRKRNKKKRKRTWQTM